MKLGRWSWGYIPVAIVLGLIWYEFWQSGAFAPPVDPPPADTQAAATSIAPPGGGTGGPVVVETPPRQTERPTLPVTVVKPPVNVAPIVPAVLTEAYLNNPPPISVTFSNVTLDSAVEALRQALGSNAVIQVANSGSNSSQRFSVDVKNAPFWEVFKTMNRQSPVDLVNAPSYAKDGLVLSNNGGGVYRILTNGPAILYPISINYIRQNSGQDMPGTRALPRYSLNLGAAVDPRIRVTRYMPVEVTEIVNDAGQPLTLLSRNTSYSSQASNYWNSSVEINAIDPGNKRASLKCLLRFTAQVSESAIEIEDAAQKTGETIMLGDRGLRLTRFEARNNQANILLTPDVPGPTFSINITITDAGGRAMNFQTQPNSTRVFSIDNMQPPYKLTLRAPDQTREMSLPFELKDIPLP